jgi:branched-chain amino acid transport system substrate-binding protein
MNRFILLLTCTMVAIGCGGGSGNNAAGPDPQAQTIRIGMLTELADLWEQFGLPFERSAQLAIDEINSSGGVLGRQLQLVSLHAAPDAAMVTANAATLIDTGVVAIIGPAFSEIYIDVAKQVTIPGGMLLISPSVTSPAVSELPGQGLTWRTIASDALTGSVAGSYAYGSLNSTTAGILFLDNVFGIGLAAAFEAEFVAMGGRIIGREPLPDLAVADVAAYDYRELVNAVTEQRPDLLFIATRESANDKISIALQRVFDDSYHPALLTSANPSTDWLANADPLVTEGIRGILAAPVTDTPAFRGYASRLQSSYGIEPALFTDGIYDCVYLLALAIEAGGLATPASIGAHLQSVSAVGTTVSGGGFARSRQLLSSASDIDYVGASGPVDLNANGDVVSGSFSIWEIRDGVFVDLESISFP